MNLFEYLILLAAVRTERSFRFELILASSAEKFSFDRFWNFVCS